MERKGVFVHLELCNLIIEISIYLWGRFCCLVGSVVDLKCQIHLAY